MGSPVTVQTRFGTLSVGLRTNHTARGKHAHVGSGRNMPGTQGKYLSTLKLCDIVSHANGAALRRAVARPKQPLVHPGLLSAAPLALPK